MQKITPFLWFDGAAEEAANFYVSVFEGGSRVLRTTRLSGTGARPGGVMTVQFELRGQQFLALNGGPAFKVSEAIWLVVSCDTPAEVDHFWSLLSRDGQEGRCGWLKDRYGLSWQIVPAGLGELLGDPDPQRARRATEAMMQMTKLDIEALRRAAGGTPDSRRDQ